MSCFLTYILNVIKVKYMITMTPITFNQKSKSVSFEKSRKEIIDEAPNKELKKLTKDLTYVSDEYVIDVGIPWFLKYAERGEVEKKQAIKILEDVINSEEIRDNANECVFYGIPYHEDGHTDNEGYLGAYERLTGIKLDVRV